MNAEAPDPADRRDFLIRIAAGGGAALAGTVAPVTAAPGEDGQATRESRMESGQPSATARGAAVSRALHQIIDAPLVFEDRFALAMVAPLSPAEIRAVLDRSAALRASIVARRRYAEDRLAECVARGVRQYVLLGAGLDTFSCRNPHAARGLRVFEVDHPATQAGKRERLAQAHIAPLCGTTFVPVDFETQSLEQRLRESGFRFDRPAFFSMLGVAIYLTHEALMQTLAIVARCRAGSEVVLSFSAPDRLLTEAQRESRRKSMARVAAAGEPWITFHDPLELARDLQGLGFGATVVLAPEDANALYFAHRSDRLRVANAYLMSARI